MKSEAVQIPLKVHHKALLPDEFLTTHELMKLLKIKHRQTLYALIEAGMPAIFVGKNYRFIRQEVIDYFKQNARAANGNTKKR